MKSTLKKIVTNVLDDFFNDEIMTRSAALAFYTSLGFAPLMVLIIVILGLLGINLQSELIHEVHLMMGPEAGKLLRSIITTANSRPDLSTTRGMLSTLGLLISATFIFVQLQDTLNLIFNLKPQNEDRPWGMAMIKDYLSTWLLSLIMMFTFILLLITSLLISTTLEIMDAGKSYWYLKFMNYVISLGLFTALFTFILKWLPDHNIYWRSACSGGFITAFLFLIGKAFIGLYLANSAVGSAYGAAGSLLVTLVWVYYSFLVVFFGAEISYISLIQFDDRTK